MSSFLDDLQKLFDEQHAAANDPLNPGISEEEEDADPNVIDATDEALGFVIVPTTPNPKDEADKSSKG
jgi:hypothetical protein